MDLISMTWEETYSSYARISTSGITIKKAPERTPQDQKLVTVVSLEVVRIVAPNIIYVAPAAMIFLRLSLHSLTLGFDAQKHQ